MTSQRFLTNADSSILSILAFSLLLKIDLSPTHLSSPDFSSLLFLSL